MSAPSPKLQRVIDDFSRQSGLTPDMIANLRATIEGAPLLTEKMNSAVELGHLNAFAALVNDDQAGALYDGRHKVINLPLVCLQSRPAGKFDFNRMTFVLGHEIQHGFNYAERVQANKRTVAEMNVIARSEDPLNHYDDPAKHWIHASRQDEAKAHIAGWNAMLNRLNQGATEVTLDDMQRADGGRARDFIEEGAAKRYQPKSGIKFNSDNSLSDTPENVEAVAKYYYDDARNIVGLAHSTYRNYDGATALGFAVEAQRRYARPHRGQEPEFLVDMEGLGLQEDKLEINGINFGNDGAKHPRQPYYDTSQGQTRPGFLDHTARSHVYVPIAPSASPSQGEGRLLFIDSAHRDHALYSELKQCLPPETSADRLAQITLAAKLGGVQAGQLQGVAINDEAVFVMGKMPGDRAKVELSTPPPAAQETIQRSEAFDRQQVQEMERFQMQQMQLNSQGQVGPRMTF